MQVWGNTCDVITVIVLWCHDSGPWHNISFLMTASNNNYQADVINNFHSNKAQFWKAHNKKISWASYGLYYSLEVTNHWINVLPLADVVGYIIKSKYRLGTPNLHWIMDMLQCILASHGRSEFPPYFKGHLQSPSTALTVGMLLNHWGWVMHYIRQ